MRRRFEPSLFILLWLQWAVSIACREDVEVVYLTDTKSPAEVEKAGGFAAAFPKQPKVEQLSVYRHVFPTGNAETRSRSVYISMTWSERVAASRVKEKGWIYMIHATANMFPVEETLGNSNVYSHKTDVLALGMVRWDQIMAFSVIDVPPAGISHLNTEAPWFRPKFAWERNPGYQLEIYSGLMISSGQPQLAGYPATHPSYKQSDVLEASARQFSEWKHQILVDKLEIDRVKSHLRPLIEIRQRLGDYMKARGKLLGFGRISRYVQKGFRISSSLVKTIAPGPLDVIAWGVGMHAAFSEDTTALTRAAALVSFIPVLRCVLEDQAKKEAGHRSAVDFVACTIGDVLVLIPPLFWAGVAIGGIRTAADMVKYLKDVPQEVEDLVSLDHLLRVFTRQWDNFGLKVLDYVRSWEFQSLNHEQFVSEVIAVEFAAAEELSAVYVGHEMIMANSSSDEERESIRLSLARAASRHYVSLCDEISVRRERLMADTHDRLMEWMEESRRNFTDLFYDAWTNATLAAIKDKYDRAVRSHGTPELPLAYMKRREEAEAARANETGRLWATIEEARTGYPLHILSRLRDKTHHIFIPEETKSFCDKYRTLTQTTSCQDQPGAKGCAADGGQPVEEADCTVSGFWPSLSSSSSDDDDDDDDSNHNNLARLRSGDLRCKRHDRSYGLNRLLFTSCPLGASKTSLLCESKPVNFLDGQDFRTLSEAGLYPMLVDGGPSQWKPAELWDEQETAVIDCKAKNISWDFFDQYTVAVAEGNLWCKFGKSGQKIRWLDPTKVVEHCRFDGIHFSCRRLDIYREPLSDNLVRRAGIFGFPTSPPPHPSTARLIDCQALGINWDVAAPGRRPLLSEASRRVADGLDRCGRRDRPGYWFQWQPAWSLAQEGSGRNYSSLVEYVDGEPRSRIDFHDGGKPLNESLLLDARLVGVPGEELPATDEMAIGRPWFGIPPKMNIICHALPWHESSLEVWVIANGLVSCGRHGSVATWHWAASDQLVRCIPTFTDASQFSCVSWNETGTMSREFKNRATINGVLLEPPTEDAVPPPMSMTRLREEVESSELEEVSAVADGCARISSLSIAIVVGTDTGAGSNENMQIGFGRTYATTDWIWLASRLDGGDVVKRSFQNLTEDFPILSNKYGKLHLRDLGPIKIRMRGYEGISFSDFLWQFQGLTLTATCDSPHNKGTLKMTRYATLNRWLPNSKSGKWTEAWRGDLVEADWRWTDDRPK
ncbi:hypothetical protein CP532_1222 [Ophiocordyceps camponoti-leonardi (nom. inval.)]|nr:hypothetical protein CP532_1222 [Ophiocordyceps camponoti-leonardi (nom. inval.)]